MKNISVTQFRKGEIGDISEPVTITRYGKPVLVAMPIEEYKRLKGTLEHMKESLMLGNGSSVSLKDSMSTPRTVAATGYNPSITAGREKLPLKKLLEESSRPEED